MFYWRHFLLLILFLQKNKCLGTIEEAKEEKGIAKRALNMEDLRQAKNQVTNSFLVFWL